MKTVQEFRYHKVKCWPEYFDAVKSGDKTFELRKNDRNYRAGDVLCLQAWDPDTGLYVGAEYEVLITYTTTFVDALKDGFIAMGIRPANLFKVRCASCLSGFRTYDKAHTHCSNCL